MSLLSLFHYLSCCDEPEGQIHCGFAQFLFYFFFVSVILFMPLLTVFNEINYLG